MRVIATYEADAGPPQWSGNRAEAGSQRYVGGQPAEIAHRSAARKSRRAFSDADLAAFFSNMATLLGSGVPLIKALEALVVDETFEKAAPTLKALVQDIRSGSSLSTALSRHPDCFSPMMISLMRAGETGSVLVSSLERVAENIEKRRETRAQIRKALTYPTIVTVLGTAAVAFLMIFVVPVFQETYSKAGMPLPAITRVLIAVSGVVVKTWWILLGMAIAAGLLYRNLRAMPTLRAARDRWLLRVPLLGPLIRSVIVGQFVEAFGSLLITGVSVKESLALSEQVVQHREYVGMIRAMRQAVARGEGLAPTLARYRPLFPPLLTQMMSLGEKSGDLGKMAIQISRYIDKDLKRKVERMSALVEPLVTIGLASAIGTIAMAIYLPIFDMFKHIK